MGFLEPIGEKFEKSDRNALTHHDHSYSFLLLENLIAELIQSYL